jgi:3-hydroxyacyl-[acyl-carrier-protein] dehydratase
MGLQTGATSASMGSRQEPDGMTGPDARVAQGARAHLFDISGIDLSSILLGREGLKRFNPHRGCMALLDAIVWVSPDCRRGVGIWHVGHDEFWVPGHFPGRPMLPGVLQIEAGAQLSCYLYHARQHRPMLAAFLRIENAAFRSSVLPGDDLLLLCLEAKFGRRRFISDVQGLVGSRVAFEARISGMMLDQPVAPD